MYLYDQISFLIHGLRSFLHETWMTEMTMHNITEMYEGMMNLSFTSSLQKVIT